MRDLLMDIYSVLIADELIRKEVDTTKHITFNEYPEVENINETRIIIDEVDEPLPEEYADNDNLALSYLIQVDVYTKVKAGTNARTLKDQLSYRIARILKDELNMTNVSNAKPEYDKEFKLYRSAKRYEGTFYREEIK